MAVYPPGPKRSILTAIAYRPGRDPIGFFGDLIKTYGDLAYVHMGGERVFLVSDPRHVRDIFVTNQRFFAKGKGLERARRFLGEGLLTSEGATHLRQRRLAQPAFHRDRIADVRHGHDHLRGPAAPRLDATAPRSTRRRK